MLLEKENSCLALIDVQEKLTPLIQNSKQLIERCEWLSALAAALNVPQIVSEQYPQGLGKTLLSLAAAPVKTIEKIHFSCWQEPDFQQGLEALHKKQIVLAGIETHVCVLQTAIELFKAGFEVFVVVDAVNSRKELDRHFALKRMKQMGITLLTSEMVFFEWLRHAGMPEFKALSKQFLQ